MMRSPPPSSPPDSPKEARVATPKAALGARVSPPKPPRGAVIVDADAIHALFNRRNAKGELEVIERPPGDLQCSDLYVTHAFYKRKEIHHFCHFTGGSCALDRIVPNEEHNVFEQLKVMRAQCIKENGDTELDVKEDTYKKMRFQMYCWWNRFMEDTRGTKPMPICVQLMIRSLGCGGDESNFKCKHN